MVVSCKKIFLICLRLFLGVGVIWGLYFLRDNLWARAYPLIISMGIWGAFLFSLKKGRTPLIERSTRAVKKQLSPAEIRYCYHLTVIWTIFMTVHLGVTVATLFLSHRFWALYNGCLAYLFIGPLFLASIAIGNWRNLG